MEKYYRVGPDSRHTIEVDELPGLESTEVSAKIEAANNTGIVAERSMYFSYKGKWTGGHNTMGATRASPSRYFAEGYTGY